MFQPTDVDGVEMAAALCNAVSCQCVPVRVLNLKEEVLIPSGTILEQATPAQEVIAPEPADPGPEPEAAHQEDWRSKRGPWSISQVRRTGTYLQTQEWEWSDRSIRDTGCHQWSTSR